MVVDHLIGSPQRECVLLALHLDVTPPESRSPFQAGDGCRWRVEFGVDRAAGDVHQAGTVERLYDFGGPIPCNPRVAGSSAIDGRSVTFAG
jgi:hypothetical protein